MVNLCKFAQKPRNYWEGFFVMESSLEGFFFSHVRVLDTTVVQQVLSFMLGKERQV